MVAANVIPAVTAIPDITSKCVEDDLKLDVGEGADGEAVEKGVAVGVGTGDDFDVGGRVAVGVGVAVFSVGVEVVTMAIGVNVAVIV